MNDDGESGGAIGATLTAGTPEALVDALAARSGIICVVGAGGKKTTMRRLAEAHPGRIGIACTAKLVPFVAKVAIGWHTIRGDDDIDALLVAARGQRIVAYSGPSDGPRRYVGLEPERIAEIHRRGGFEVTLVKADGARMRFLKGRRPEEPPLVAGASTIISLCSVQAVGRCLDESSAHRPDHVAKACGAALGEILRPEHLGRLLAHQHGELAAKSETRVVSVINMVDTAEDLEHARMAASSAFDVASALPAIVLASFAADPPRFEVLERGSR